MKTYPLNFSILPCDGLSVKNWNIDLTFKFVGWRFHLKLKFAENTNWSLKTNEIYPSSE